MDQARITRAMYLETCRVHHMATWKGLRWIGRRKEVFVADWAVIHKRFLPTYMHLERPRHASIAIHAMKIVNAQSLPYSAQITIRAVVDFPVAGFLLEAPQSIINIPNINIPR